MAAHPIRQAALAVITVGVVLIGGACAPAREAALPLPTRAVLPSAYLIEDAERTARAFLGAWQNADYLTMHRLLSFPAQEAAPLDDFIALYTDAAAAMTLDTLDYTVNTLYREQDSIAVFNYNVEFHTRRLGDFTDTARDMRLVVDEQADEWRLAWSSADLFPQMAGGGRLRVVPTIPNRANIYDRDGVTLADQNGRIVAVQVTRDRIPNYAECLNRLAGALDQSVDEVLERLEARPSNWRVEVGVIEAATYTTSAPGLEESCAAEFDNRPVRRYLDGEIAPHILGYVGYPTEEEVAGVEAEGFRADSILGRAGIEASWNETLRGVPAARLIIVSPTGEELREIANARAQPGQSVWLTLDRDFQAATELILADAYTQAKDSWAQTSKGAAVVAIDVRTGEILAMVSYPTFDNNAYNPFPVIGRAAGQAQIVANQANPRRPEVNRAAQGVYPLGSVMKTISGTAIADANVLGLDERYTCTALWSRDIPRVDWYAPGHGTLTLQTALMQSCNPFFYEVGYRIDQADSWLLPNFSRHVGFGEQTGIGDIAEEPGLIPDPDWLRTTYGLEWTFSDAVNMSIGQGYVQVTPLQVARWFAALANGGDLLRPTLVRQTGLLGESLEMAYTVQSEPLNIQPDVMRTVQAGLCAVTTEQYGTAEFVFRNSQLQSIGVCGKTGTAQTAGDNPPNAWFAAWAPRAVPEIAVVVLVENAGEGSAVAAPIARQVLEAWFYPNEP